MIRRAALRSARPFLVLATVTSLLLAGPQSAWACPFCAAVSQTFSEEVDAMDVAVIATLVDLPEDMSETGGVQAKFKAEIVLKGEEHLPEDKTIKSLYYGEGKIGRKFLILGSDTENIMWSTPTLLTDRAVEYIQKAINQPKEGAERLKFFQQFLEDEDEMLTRDAYDEFANAPYDWVINLKPEMDHAQLVAWINDQDVPANRRRLYFTMLGVSGSPSDLPMLEKLLRSEDRKDKAGLDALIGCYLTLAGADGMDLIEELYLKDNGAEYADTYAAIMAIRFHGTETDVIPKERLLKGLHHMLDRPSLADLVIVDLARWEDWSVADRLVKLFKEADEDTSWVRVPVIRYLMACPKPEAKEYLSELEKIDPDAVKRAQTFFPFRNSAVPTRADGERLAASRLNDDVAPASNIVPIDDNFEVNPLIAPTGGEMAKSQVSRDRRVTAGDRELASAVNREIDRDAISPARHWGQLTLPLVATSLIAACIWGLLCGPGQFRGRANN
ncbi:MAG: hypothetical protein WDZ51_16900 [Pirellulaceae bacterium]